MTQATDRELMALVKDKTDFRKRLALIESLRVTPRPGSAEALRYLACHDFVYEVRLAAWSAAVQQGIALKKPLARPRYALFTERLIARIKKICAYLGECYYSCWATLLAILTGG
ncbi:hypothetical protein RI820_003091 [Pluralibacter gergoviae]|uniref:hypothetical protein n=1 Tax=Pluralibacter gergoviae TaxID=61647 RepID=UPI0008DC264B|nr:hypothetical protein [Pluralibacter gergoviae]EKW6618565.1 hypothetical protein [Pluralibacter gergoviae]EKZ9515980.1 hypothetical protein [Pluralibacter gergoviae]ELC3018030.1 hypothetical protein [Pluralibacter gergoviae]ELC3023156.1 hypothetical protein [Pluralibacter gergoviae]ELG9927998.1 hypothetical protein [Pluralibacter gergoviae]